MAEQGPTMRISAHTRSDVGLVRQSNEDGVFAGSTAFAVADGMGGHAAGEVASATALRPLAALDGQRFSSDEEIQRALLSAVESANRSVVGKAEEDPTYQGMGTTLTAAVIQDERLHLAHVGDSRAYLLRGQRPLIQLTTDHTVVEELVQNGRLAREQVEDHPQRSVITRAIGIEDEVDADSFPALALQPGDQVLLCSDGLTGPVGDEEIAEILRAHDDGEAACEALVEAAKDAGGPDNITVLLVRVARDAAGSSAGASAASPDATQELTVGDAGGPSSGPDTREYARREWAAASGSPAGGPPGARGAPGTTAPGGAAPGGAPPGGAPPGGAPPAPGGAPPAPGGAPPGPHTGRDRPSQAWRLVALVTGLVVVVALLGGLWVLASRAWFVGEEDGSVAVFRGVPTELAGVRLYQVTERSDIAVDELAPRWQQRLDAGIRRTSAAQAEELVDRLREEAERDPLDSGAAPSGLSSAGRAGAGPDDAGGRPRPGSASPPPGVVETTGEVGA